MKVLQNSTVVEVIELSKLLGDFGQIERVTRLPDGRPESDSHHSFSLALISFELATQFAPELDIKKVLLYSLVHDLPELVTGDTNTLTATSEDLALKSQQDKDATLEIKKIFKNAPSILSAIEAYELKEDDESLFVYWIDKMATIPTHFYDSGKNLRALGITNRSDIQQWYERTLDKLGKHRQAHTSAVQILEMTYVKMHDELLDK
jgi:5'-deoxynucleotidase YfbR-like HD superfamily hydrolase